MCGIGGILRITPSGASDAERTAAADSDRDWARAIDLSIAHRGPDGQGLFTDRVSAPDGSIVDVVLLHRRMAIIDLAGGDQPMVAGSACASSGTEASPADSGKVSDRTAGTDRSSLIAVVFNGCIYNHRPLRAELEALGHRFRTDHSDTEVLLHGWRAWGPELFARLEGMFALALWDREAASLVLARDRFGEKPLYWTEGLDRDGAHVFAFASTPTALRGRTTGAGGEKAGARVAPWLRFGWGPRPPLLDVEVLGPGEARGFGVEAARRFGLAQPPLPPRSWRTRWSPALSRRTGGPTPDDVERELSRAVRERLEADVPLGCFLSGGVDSSLILKFAHDADPDIHAFTVRMPDPGIDESRHAAAVAHALGVRHEILDCQAKPAEDLVRLIGQLGLPFGDSSLLPTYWVSRAAAQRVKVALSGDGGDELFAGYERYRAAGLFAMLGPVRPLLRPFAHGGGDADPKSTRTRRARFIQAAAGGGFADLLSVFPSSMLSELVPGGRELSDRRGWIASVRDLAAELTGRAATAHAISCDVLGYLPDDILRKTDTASMAVPIEVRAPFLDSRLAELALSARISALTPGGERKGLLRQVARRHLPAAVVDRPKQGFAIPIGEWFRTDFGGLRTLLFDTLHAADPFPASVLGCEINTAYVRRLEREHAERIVDHGQRLYLLLVLSLWARTIEPAGQERR